MKVAIVATLLLWASAAHAVERSAFADIAQIQRRGEIVVAMIATDEPPLISGSSDGKPSGFAPALASEIASRLGVELRIRRDAKTHDEIIAIVSDGFADLGISSLSRTSERALQVLFTEPYVRGNLAAVVNRVRGIDYGECPTLEQLGELSRKEGELAVPGGSSFLQDLPDRAREVVRKDSQTDVLRAVEQGEVVAGIVGETTGRWYLQQNPSARVKVAFCTFASVEDSFSIAVQPGAPNLVSWINVLLDRTGARYTPAQLVEKAGAWDLTWKDRFGKKGTSPEPNAGESEPPTTSDAPSP